MEIKNEDLCWSCQYSDFDPLGGELVCSCDEEQRPESCPCININQDNIIKIESHQKLNKFGDWRKLA
ncbi:MAG: hypothetical protein OQK25_05175 [Gammaproteobacteria bacterium]|nr:hypothetical protein [Gammaproteobacteria bacterium]